MTPGALGIDPLWLAVEARRGNNGCDEPAIEMRFHNDWWHKIFDTPTGYQVVLGPIGIDLGTWKTMGEAKTVAARNARERALNAIEGARTDLRRAALVLGALSQ